MRSGHLAHEYEGTQAKVMSEYDPRTGKDFSTVDFGFDDAPNPLDCTKRLDGGQRAINAKLKKQKLKLPFAK